MHRNRKLLLRRSHHQKVYKHHDILLDHHHSHTSDSTMSVIAEYFTLVTPFGKSPVDFDIDSAGCEAEHTTGYYITNVTYVPLRPSQSMTHSPFQLFYVDILTLALFLPRPYLTHRNKILLQAHRGSLSCWHLAYPSVCISGRQRRRSLPRLGVLLFLRRFLHPGGTIFALAISQQIPDYIPDPCPINENQTWIPRHRCLQAYLCSVSFCLGGFLYVSPKEGEKAHAGKFLYSVIHMSLIAAWYKFILTYPKYNYIL